MNAAKRPLGRSPVLNYGNRFRVSLSCNCHHITGAAREIDVRYVSIAVILLVHYPRRIMAMLLPLAMLWTFGNQIGINDAFRWSHSGVRRAKKGLARRDEFVYTYLLARYTTAAGDALPIMDLVWNLLVIDDSQWSLDLFSLAAQEAGMPVAVHAALSGIDALNLLAKKGPHHGAPTPDLIVTDLQMPHMTGLQLLQILKKSQWQDIPVVVLSATARAEDSRQAHDHGAVAVWSKNIAWDEFVRQLPRLLTYLGSKASVQSRTGTGGT